MSDASNGIGLGRSERDELGWDGRIVAEVERLRAINAELLAALKPFASDASLFPSAAPERRQELRPAMYFAIADYDRAREAIAKAKGE